MSHHKFARPLRAASPLSVLAGAALALAACAAPSTDGSDAGGAGSGDSITVAWESGAKVAMDAAVDDFQKANPDSTVNVEYLSPDQLNSTLTTQLAAGGGPDLFRSDNGSGTPKATLTLARRGLLTPFTGDWTTEVSGDLLENSTIDGEVYGFIPSITGLAQVLNQDKLAEYGLTAPTTWTGVLDFCRAAREKGTVAYTAGVASSFEARSVLYAMSYQAVYADTPDFDQAVSEGSLTWPESGWREAVDKNVEMAEAGCFPDDFTGIDAEGAFNQLFSGQVLGIVGYAAYLQYAPEGVNFGLYPLPLSEDPDESGMVVSPFGAMAMNKNSKNPELAQKFVDFLATPEVNAEFVENSSPTGGLLSPFYRDLPAPTDQVSQQLITFLENGRSNQFPDASFPGAQVTTTLEQQMQLALAGQASTDQVLEAVQTSWDQAAQ